MFLNNRWGRQQGNGRENRLQFKSVGYIDYVVRVSRRARNVLLKVHPHNGLEVVIPEGFNRKLLPGILEKKQGWIINRLKKYNDEAATREAGPPNVIRLRAVHQEIILAYNYLPGDKLILKRTSEGAMLCGDLADQNRVLSQLRYFLKDCAKKELPGWLERLARQHGLSPGRCSIRLQKTRWGSCSSKGSINLNAKLMLLPPELAEYVLLHELAHLRQPNHSKAYWRLLSSMAPEVGLREAQLKQAWKYVPAWVEMG
jgi:predicted metal-dependent hydrolase